ncbi:hypothetical protein [Pelagicoccus mobilis]|uniref:PPi-type phosphoenolpyruvate carboxykinase lobe 2 domain-containing protein n=1 Tax=Pelagicoccus mobilis TaxID=415221 RepID=A0A934S1R0_9BACT|nr:hypothetical protein [Pelagicoccus mobilis]MBK1877839.1 hypothetical protein [Pelagicoccus mobilis]
MDTQSTDLKTQIGFDPETGKNCYDESSLTEYLNIKLRSRGLPIYGDESEFPFLKMGNSLLKSVQEKNRLLKQHLCPADQRIQKYLEDLFEPLGAEERLWLPSETLIIERHGMARALSIPPNVDKFESDIVSSFRTKQGILNNPKSDRRTTKGVFHVAEGGLPIAADKKQVPLVAFKGLLAKALTPPDSLLELPFTAAQEEKARTFVSLLLRPLVQPAVAGVTEEKRMEVRFFAPGNMTSNLDFVESIFGNAGDPFLAENDAGLDVKNWSGHTGCVILAPHLIYTKKKDLGLPHISEATERQKRDGMCWEKDDELYNDGGAFKITSRDSRGVVVTLIADNYYGYCKKEVKTQISYASNLYGNVEEEHAGGALAFASYDLGEDFHLSKYTLTVDHTYDEAVKALGESVDFKPEGYAIDKKYSDIFYVPEGSRFTLTDQKISWVLAGVEHELKIQPDNTYILPSGYKVEMTQPMAGRRWRLLGTSAVGTYCHKPCTVSGGGKSEISKSLTDAIVAGPVFTADLKKDFDIVEEIVSKNYGARYKDASLNRKDTRPLLSTDRSLGSVIKLLSPSPAYTDEYNEWLDSIPGYVIDIVLVVKRFYKDDWGTGWRDRFSVDIVNGRPGNELKYRDQKLISQYLRVGFAEDGSWRVFSLRKDFYPASKIQTEDDISSAVVVPAEHLDGLDRGAKGYRSLKFIQNCEYRLFQRPDEAIHRGYDKTTEKDFSGNGLFFSNYEPLTRDYSNEMVKDAIRFGQFTQGMQDCILDFNAAGKPDYVISSSNPRLVDGVPTKNPRYLQNRLDLEDERSVYVANVGAALYRRLAPGTKPHFPVNCVLPGRRNNGPSEGIRALAPFGPVHYQELPEAFMDFIASLTGKSPSTTGAGSEGALTKGPFNALLPIVDMNQALVSYIVTGYECFISSAGCVGPNFRCDHDISLLIPEIWCRMKPDERRAAYMIEKGYLEPCKDFEYEGETIEASRLGYRITSEFVQAFGGRVFSNPRSVFPEDILRPEQQDMAIYVDAIKNIVETQRRIALNYFDDGSIDDACPPLKALLHIMAHGEYEGMTYHDPEFRKLFSYEEMVKSDWYKARLDAKQKVDVSLWERHQAYLDSYLSQELNEGMGDRIEEERLRGAIARRLETFRSEEYRKNLDGCIGVDPSVYK